MFSINAGESLILEIQVLQPMISDRGLTFVSSRSDALKTKKKKDVKPYFGCVWSLIIYLRL